MLAGLFITMAIFFAVILISLIPRQEIPTDQVDWVELNHVHDEAGKPTFTQYIVWRYYWDRQRWHVVAWVIVSDDTPRPRRLWRHGGSRLPGWELVLDHKDVLRRLRFRTYNESHSLYDPEMADRALLPMEARRGLLPSIKVANKKLLAPAPGVSFD